MNKHLYGVARYARVAFRQDDGTTRRVYVKAIGDRVFDGLLAGQRVTRDGDLWESRDGEMEIIVWSPADEISRKDLVLDLHYGTLVSAEEVVR